MDTNNKFNIDPALRGELDSLFGVDYSATLVAQAETLNSAMEASGIHSKAKPAFLNGKDDDEDEDDKTIKALGWMLQQNQKQLQENAQLKNQVASFESKLDNVLTDLRSVTESLHQILGTKTKASKHQASVVNGDIESDFLQQMNGDPDSADAMNEKGMPIFNQVIRQYGNNISGVANNQVTPPSAPINGNNNGG